MPSSADVICNYKQHGGKFLRETMGQQGPRSVNLGDALMRCCGFERHARDAAASISRPCSTNRLWHANRAVLVLSCRRECVGLHTYFSLLDASDMFASAAALPLAACLPAWFATCLAACLLHGMPCEFLQPYTLVSPGLDVPDVEMTAM